MKKSTKILLCISAASIALGVVLLAAGIALGADPAYALQSGMLDLTLQKERTQPVSPDGRYALPAEGLTGLSIDWVDGRVVVETYDGDEILFQETASCGLDEGSALAYEVRDHILYIDSTPTEVGLFLSGTFPKDKELHVYLPKAAGWRELEISAVDADVAVSGAHLAKLKADLTAGDLTLSQTELEELSFSSVSGDLRVSGAQAEKVHVSTTSGALEAQLERCPQSIHFDTVSGNAALYLPEDSAFTVQLDTVSGVLESDFPSIQRDDTFTVGDGSARFDMETTSGSVQIRRSGE